MIFILIVSLLLFSAFVYSLLATKEFDLFKWTISIVLSMSLLSVLFSITLFLHLSYSIYLGILGCLCIIAAIYFFASRISGTTPKFNIDKWVLLFLFEVLIGTVFFAKNSTRWGKWDAWAIWNLHAKFLYNDNLWHTLFTTKISWTHPDYPLMLPSLIALFWKGIGGIDPVVPVLVAYFVFISILSLLYSSLTGFRFKIIGVAGVILLAMDSHYLSLAASQYADTLLSMFILIAVILVSKKKDKPVSFFFLIGLISSFTIWIKNEGIIFFSILLILLIFQHYKNTSKILFFLVGALPIVCVYSHFKFAYAPPSYMIKAQDVRVLQKVLSFDRYIIICEHLIVLIFEKYFLLLITAGIAFILHPKKIFSHTVVILISTFALYLSVYVITPYELNWHLDTSLDRLLHQLYPAFLYCFLLVFHEVPFTNSRYYRFFQNWNLK